MTKDDFEAWKGSRLTQDVMRMFDDLRIEATEKAALASMNNKTEVGIVVDNALNFGMAAAYKDIVGLTWEEYNEWLEYRRVDLDDH